MDLVCRVLCEAQQDYFAYVVAKGNGTDPATPSFDAILNKVMTYRVESLSPLPSGWYLLMGAPRVRGNNRPNPTSTSPRAQAGAHPTDNNHADERLLLRFQESGHASIQSLIAGHEGDVPKLGGDPVCLTWALKGRCSPTCRRGAQHVRYPARTISQLHGFLTTCGVANPQE